MRKPENSPQEPRRLKTRAALLLAGSELLAERPIDAIPVDDIVAAAGVAKGSFFNHFADKAAFAAAIAAEIRADVEARVTEANAGVSDPARRIARGLVGFVRFARNEPRRARIMLRGLEWSAFADHPLNSGLRTDIESGLASGRFMAPSTAAAIIFVGGVGHMLLMALLADPAGAEAARRKTADLLALTLTGLGVATAEAGTLADEAAAEIRLD